jgi:flavin-dependent dehydrogenase
MQENYDAIVVGGGPSGATAAAFLARAGWRVAVVEKVPFPRRKVCGEFISETTWPLLRQLGVAGPLLKIAGPPVRRVGVYAGDVTVTAKLASTAGSAQSGGGRAVGREHLDTLLLQRAAIAGATIWQPCALAQFVEHASGYECTVVDRGTRQSRVVQSRLIVAAHGSWESGPLPTQDLRRKASPSDLFGFKAHFIGSTLPLDLMPLLAFPGGYGGMVHTDAGRVSLSCCIRRDQLERCRRQSPGVRAGHAVLLHIASSCMGVSLALAATTLDGVWLSSGPLRTGMRTFGRDGIFAVGNAAAETHPIVAEGISMAIQSAALLCEQLIATEPVPPARSRPPGLAMRVPGAPTFHPACSWLQYSHACSRGLFPRLSQPHCWSASRNSFLRVLAGAANHSRCAAFQAQGGVGSRLHLFHRRPGACGVVGLVL